MFSISEWMQLLPLRARGFISSNPSTWTTWAQSHFGLHRIWLQRRNLQQFLFHIELRTSSRRGSEDSQHPLHPVLPPAMETEVRFCPKWHGALRFGLFLLLSGLLGVAEAEITCRSCRDGNLWSGAQELLLRVETSGPAAGVMGEVLGSGDRTGRVPCEPGPAGCAPDRGQHAQLRRDRITDSGKVSQHRDGVGSTPRRFRRDSGGDAVSSAPAEGAAAAAGRRAARWSGEERRAAGARQEELKLNSSTFALTGDSSHNQAMVHWSGQNSSVSHTPALVDTRVRA